ncbi:hypothetical protein KUF71_000456 [Frankliniella fusca]|uniref:Uncharacterized protein n=1 Tax=Frankliniella fusca TaxID=407009 RepID=A0AAE1HT77_9NEOP|nr:hypothetical protein KUF71_000456 [Frankliniella fusca]
MEFSAFVMMLSYIFLLNAVHGSGRSDCSRNNVMKKRSVHTLNASSLLSTIGYVFIIVEVNP